MARTAVRGSRIFISYRREESAYPAGWLFDRLEDHFDDGQIFKDVDSIRPGDDFREAIVAAVASCDVLLALIGPRWLTVTDQDGRRRLDNRDDFVRPEIETALARNVRVIPILVDGAPPPKASEMPPGMAKLAGRQAIELDPTRFVADSDRLVTVLGAALDELRTHTYDPARPLEALRALAPDRRNSASKATGAQAIAARRDPETRGPDSPPAELRASARRLVDSPTSATADWRAHASRLSDSSDSATADRLVPASPPDSPVTATRAPATRALDTRTSEWRAPETRATEWRAPAPRGTSPGPGYTPAPKSNSRGLLLGALGATAALVAVVVLLAVLGSGGGDPTDPVTGGDGDIGATLKVPGSPTWTDTAIDLDAGDEITVNASGTFYDDVVNQPTRSYGPDGDPDLAGEHAYDRYDFNHAALMGRIGEDGEPFFVGAEAEIVVSDSGRLFLGIHDFPDVDNGGEYVAVMRVIRH